MNKNKEIKRRANQLLIDLMSDEEYYLDIEGFDDVSEVLREALNTYLNHVSKEAKKSLKNKKIDSKAYNEFVSKLDCFKLSLTTIEEMRLGLCFLMF